MYKCDKCNYETQYKSHLDRHMKSNKHKIYTCDTCGKIYKSRSGLWKHNNNCGFTLEKHLEKLTNILETSIKHNSLMTSLIPKMSGNTINNKISINVFLNDKCSNAVNFQKFLNDMNITLEDLDITKNNGYVNGISNIFLKNLSLLNTTERPIHCSDKKRLQFYIKDENKWDKGEIEKVETAISQVAQKQILQIKEWEKEHPDWNTNAKETDEYLALIKAVMGGSTDKEQHKNKKDIVKILGNELHINNNLLV